MSAELELIKDSLRADAGLPKVPEVKMAVRTVDDVKTELDSLTFSVDVLNGKLEELRSRVVLLANLLENTGGVADECLEVLKARLERKQ